MDEKTTGQTQKANLYQAEYLGSGTFRITKPKRSSMKRRRLTALYCPQGIRMDEKTTGQTQKANLYQAEYLGSGTFRITKPKRSSMKRRQAALKNRRRGSRR